MTKRFLAVLLAFTLVLFTAIPAFAATDTTVSGTVLSIDVVAGTFQIGTEAGDTLTVTPPAGFDLTTLTVGDVVAIQGALEEGNLTATSILPVVDDGGEEEKGNKGFYCTNADSSQPALVRLADEFSADYAQLLDWFCNGRFGVGEIMLALKTSQGHEGMSAQAILDMRNEGGGWGQVWKELGLIGHGHNSDDDGTEAETEVETENNPADAANEHPNNGNGQAGEHGNSGGNGKGHKQGNGKGH